VLRRHSNRMQNEPNPTVSKLVFSLNCSQVDNEVIALIFSVKKFHQYIYGRYFVVYTDHQTLLGLFGENKLIPPWKSLSPYPQVVHNALSI